VAGLPAPAMVLAGMSTPPAEAPASPEDDGADCIFEGER